MWPFVRLVSSSVTRCWSKSNPIKQQFSLKKRCFSKKPQKSPNFWAKIVSKFVTKNLKSYPIWSHWCKSLSVSLFIKNGPSPASFSFIFCPLLTNNKFYLQINVTNVHLVPSAVVQTHDLFNTSLHA